MASENTASLIAAVLTGNAARMSDRAKAHAANASELAALVAKAGHMGARELHLLKEARSALDEAITEMVRLADATEVLEIIKKS